ncbi:pentapeptide repeat-containing protein [Saccharopolyspora terrae]|uniref:Pentapeptide repeat-containing protein n=1 Tax=Saccharopolyspora terrae TaxID=2530384 RepID=A0A4R4V943_9PSEU|nr:pentapeptide repeat-containing protein [Saccharopolyspora terrae]TDD01829.1 pentapeptide repeat-containing protein [Saccharopolyspora terrae]
MLAQWQMLFTGLVILSLAGIAGSTVAARKRLAQESGTDDEAKPLLREIPGWAIWAGMACLVAVGLLATWWLVTSYGSGDSKTIEQNRIKLEAIKLAGSVVVGTGGVAALLLAARRQRVSELDLLQRDRVADANRHDADERRATEQYTAAAEQLASDKAPVRMAGMYALSRLGETNKNLRQTIINLLCAYLRMPDISLNDSASPSGESSDCQEDGAAVVQRREHSSQSIVLDLASGPLAALTSLAPDLSSQQQQERQVRLTAQRLLSHHLRPNRGDDGEPTSRSYWPDMDIELADSNLHEIDFTGCEVRNADFRRTQFHGVTMFEGAQFRQSTWFGGAQFYNTTWFENAQFHDVAEFHGAQFHHTAWFESAQFHEYTRFSGAEFHDDAGFSGARFHYCVGFDNVQLKHAEFSGAEFHDGVFRDTDFRDYTGFSGVHFHGHTRFESARFHDHAEFDDAQFHGYADFKKAQFHDDARFRGAQFHNITRFEVGYFAKEPYLDDAWAHMTLDEHQQSTWPNGWTTDEVVLEDAREVRWWRLTREKLRLRFA